VVVELEDLNEYRFYKLRIDINQRCESCGGHLWLYRDKGTIFKKCMHTDCLRVHDIIRRCTYCGTEHEFEDLTCDNCEGIVINITTMSVTIDECNKAIKKINRQFKNGLLTEKEWQTSLQINKEEKIRCSKELIKIRETIGSTFIH